MTVKELKERLNELNDDYEVLFEDKRTGIMSSIKNVETDTVTYKSTTMQESRVRAILL